MKRCFVLLFTVVTLGRLLAGETATAVATVTAGFVTAITVNSGGSGYIAEPSVTLIGGGGSGAAAKAILNGDKVGTVVVLTAGSGYTGSPTVTIEAPPKALGVKLELIPKLTVEGTPGYYARVAWAADLAGPWTTWSNIVVGAGGTVLVDLRPEAKSQFYRVHPGGPPGFVWIDPGTFVMGSPQTEWGRQSDETQHTVTLTQGFWISDHEVTQAEYQAVMQSNPSYQPHRDDFPVAQVSWNAAIAYCQKLTELERGGGRITVQRAYRLPTEAEWEYAARAGTTGLAYGDHDAIAWFSGNSGNQVHAVRSKQPNAWGLYDMLGSVFEWCSDYYDAYPTGAVVNPKGPSLGSRRVIRGGCWVDGAGSARSACRARNFPDQCNTTGFRPVLSEVR